MFGRVEPRDELKDAAKPCAVACMLNSSSDDEDPFKLATVTKRNGAE